MYRHALVYPSLRTLQGSMSTMLLVLQSLFANHLLSFNLSRMKIKTLHYITLHKHYMYNYTYNVRSYRSEYYIPDNLFLLVCLLPILTFTSDE